MQRVSYRYIELKRWAMPRQPSELDTDEGQDLLRACVFRLRVEGRMVSMGEMNE